YLNIPNILSIATSTPSDPLHPAYPFFPENPHFPQFSQPSQLKFIPPTYQSIHKIPIKHIPKPEIIKPNLPLLPPTQPLIQTIHHPKKIPKKIPYPLIIKPTPPRRPKAIPLPPHHKQLQTAYRITQQEAETPFANR
ncbi:biotin carboxylase N-terminal domain-containing protein, partial [Staphylococcus epidermidis]|uniref:biotin carboxylase N-terminal domain-containing protein n=1 Tax=Staphylococcus epidermidis TaxID=1282 RepID=UPI0028CBB77A